MRWWKVHTRDHGADSEMVRIFRPIDALIHTATQTLSHARLSAFRDPEDLLKITARENVDYALAASLEADGFQGDRTHYLVTIDRQEDIQTREITLRASLLQVFPEGPDTEGSSHA